MLLIPEALIYSQVIIIKVVLGNSQIFDENTT